MFCSIILVLSWGGVKLGPKVSSNAERAKPLHQCERVIDGWCTPYLQRGEKPSKVPSRSIVLIEVVLKEELVHETGKGCVGYEGAYDRELDVRSVNI